MILKCVLQGLGKLINEQIDAGLSAGREFLRRALRTRGGPITRNLARFIRHVAGEGCQVLAASWRSGKQVERSGAFRRLARLPTPAVKQEVLRRVEPLHRRSRV